jgi:hypothetical protein
MRARPGSSTVGFTAAIARATPIIEAMFDEARRGALALGFALAPALGSCAAPEADRAERTPLAATLDDALAGGMLHGWPEATAHLRVEIADDGVTVDVGAARPIGLDAFWSIASTRPAAGFFYADAVREKTETRIAHALGVTRVSDIRDAAALSFTRGSVGPVPVGGIVLVEHAPSRRYLAIVVEAIRPTDPTTAGAGPYAHADVTWYLSAEGSGDFGGAR